MLSPAGIRLPLALRRRLRGGSEFVLLSGSVALAAAGFGALSAAARRGAEPDPGEQPPKRNQGGEPEVPDEPLGVPAEDAPRNGEVELPGFPRSDPSHG